MYERRELRAHPPADVVPILAGGAELGGLWALQQYDWAMAMAAMKVSTNEKTRSPGDTSRIAS